MKNDALTIRKNRFISYIILCITIFTTNSLNLLLYGFPFVILSLIAARINKNPDIVSYFVIFFGFCYLFVKSHFEDSISIPLIIFVFLSLSIVFQRIGTVLFSSLLSSVVLTYHLSIYLLFNNVPHNPIEFALLKDSLFYEFSFFIISFITVLYCYQTYTFQKLQNKSETETINAKKGRKKVNILLNNMAESTRSVSDFSAELNNSIINLKDYSEESSIGFKDMNKTFSHQNENIKTIDKSINQIDENIKVVNKSFKYMFNNLHTTTEITSEGHIKLQNLEDTIITMDETINFLKSDMLELNNQSENIMAILDFIIDIANKTNILALNAGIEASRAGNEFKGFIVIANEVKKLSNKSKQSVKKIEEIVKEINKQTKQTVQRTKNSEIIVSQSKVALNDLKESFDVISKGTNDTFSLSNDVHTRIENLSETSKLIVEQILHLSNSNEQNTSEIEGLFEIVEKQNEHIKKISEGFETLERKLQELSLSNKKEG